MQIEEIEWGNFVKNRQIIWQIYLPMIAFISSRS